jgi:hypothetical protein
VDRRLRPLLAGVEDLAPKVAEEYAVGAALLLQGVGEDEKSFVTEASVVDPSGSATVRAARHAAVQIKAGLEFAAPRALAFAIVVGLDGEGDDGGS